MKRKPHKVSYLTTLARKGDLNRYSSRIQEELLTIFEISIATLRAKDEKAPHCNVTSYCGCTRPPDHRVANEIDLAMIFNPKVLCSFRQ